MSAQSQADALRSTAERGKDRISTWWEEVRKSWDEHLKEVQKHFDDKRAEHDVTAAQRRADRAEDDAEFAAAYAYAAIEETEYAVLDAALARMEAEELTDGISAR